MWQLLLALATLGQAGGLSTLSTEQLIARIPELPNKDYWKEDPFGECEFAPLWPSISAKRYSYSPEPREADPLIKEILRRGASAVPTLLKHLDDKRETKLTIEHENGFGGMWFQDCYVPRVHTYFDDPRHTYKWGGSKPVHKYTLKVGDFCYEALGEIVNRSMSPVRAVPTNCVMLSSPVQSKSLAAETRQDWRGLDRAGHIASLIADANDKQNYFRVRPTLLRLWFYYPKEAESQIVKMLGRRLYPLDDVWNFCTDIVNTDSTVDWRTRLDAFERLHGKTQRDAVGQWMVWIHWLTSYDHPEESRSRSRKFLKTFFPDYDPSHPEFVDSAELSEQVYLVEALEGVSSPAVEKSFERLFRQAKGLKPVIGEGVSRVDELWLKLADRLAGSRVKPEVRSLLEKRLLELGSVTKGDLPADKTTESLAESYREALAKLDHQAWSGPLRSMGL